MTRYLLGQTTPESVIGMERSAQPWVELVVLREEIVGKVPGGNFLGGVFILFCVNCLTSN